MEHWTYLFINSFLGLTESRGVSCSCWGRDNPRVHSFSLAQEAHLGITANLAWIDLAPNVSLSSFWMRILKVWGSSEVPISKFPVSGLQGPLPHPAMSWGSDPGRSLGRAIFAGRSRELRASPNHGAEGAPEGKGSTESLPMLL